MWKHKSNREFFKVTLNLCDYFFFQTIQIRFAFLSETSRPRNPTIIPVFPQKYRNKTTLHHLAITVACN